MAPQLDQMYKMAKAAHHELVNFVNKFLFLWKSGFQGTLHVEAQNGKTLILELASALFTKVHRIIAIFANLVHLACVEGSNVQQQGKLLKKVQPMNRNLLLKKTTKMLQL